MYVNKGNFDHNSICTFHELFITKLEILLTKNILNV